VVLTSGACAGLGEDGAASGDGSESVSDSSMSAGSASAGTAESGGESPGSLIDHAAWVTLAAEDDPVSEHRPAEIDCGVGGWYLEDTGAVPKLEVDTNQCNYLALSQPSLRAITAGDTLQVSFYHFDLVAPEPAEGHLQLRVDGNVVWDYLIPIPTDEENNKTPAAFIDETVVVEFDAPAGAEVYLHLHNHGQNTWNVVDLALVEG